MHKQDTSHTIPLFDNVSETSTEAMRTNVDRPTGGLGPDPGHTIRLLVILDRTEEAKKMQTTS